MIIDLAEKKEKVTDLKSKDQQIAYIAEMKAANKPNLATKTGTLKPVERITDKDFKATPVPLPKRRSGGWTAARTHVVPKGMLAQRNERKVAGNL